MRLHLFIGHAFALAAAIGFSSLLGADASPPVTVDGVVVDSSSGTPLGGASVVLDGVKTETDPEGRYFFKEVASAGEHQMSLFSPGHPEKKMTVNLVPGENHLPETVLSGESVVVVEKIVLTESKDDAADKFSEKSGTETSVEIVSGMDLAKGNAQSSSDFLKNTAGVSVSGGAGGSSTVSVRGIDQRMLRITVDGQRQGGSGNPLDNIPAEIVQSLEVTKTFTPDMEADAVGGVINVNTGGIVAKAASLQGRHQITFNSLESRPGSKNSFTWTRPFAFFAPKPNASFMVTGNYEDQYRLRERISDLRQWTDQVSPGPAPFAGMLVPTLTLPLIESTVEHRQRTGLVSNVDVRTHDTALYFRANFNSELTTRDRNYDDTDPASGTVQALTTTRGVFSGVEQSRRNQRGESQRDALNLTLGGSTQLEKLTLDANLGYARTHEFEPEGYETGYVTDHTYLATYDIGQDPFHPVYTFQDEITPSDAASGNDPKRYHLDYLQISRSDALDEEVTFKANAKYSLGKSKASENYFKFGGKVQQRRRTVGIDRQVFNQGPEIRDLTGLVGDPMIDMTTVDYQFGALPNAAAVAGLLKTAPGVFQENTVATLINTQSGDYSITEKVWALYAMGKMKRGAWTWLGGLRAEGTQVDSSANQMDFASDGTLLGFKPARGKSDYVEFLPGLHLRYDSSSGWLFRSSVTRSLSRPAYADIAPFRTLSFIDRRSRIGSPNLKPYQSTNFDLSVDKYSERFGLFSFAVFFKKIDHFITDEQYEVTIGDLGKFIEFRRINGESALAAGFEANWQSSSWNLPAGLGKATVEANYSFNHGEAHHPGRPNEIFPLPRQVDHQANVRFRAERGRLTVDASVRYRTGWWEDLIAVGRDNYIVAAWDAEFSVAYKIGKSSRITAGVTNLLNQPIRHYAGVISRMNDYQRSGLDFSAGLQWKL